MGQITADQSQELISTLTTGINWSEIDFVALGLQDVVMRNGKEACRNFESFLRNGCRLTAEQFLFETGELAIELPALSRPTLDEIQMEYSWVKSIELDRSPEGPVTLNLGTVLYPNEQQPISGSEYERRLASKLNVVLGYQHWQWFLNHQNQHSDSMVYLGKIRVDFSGIVVVDRWNCRNIPYSSQFRSCWGGDWGLLTDEFCSKSRIAIARK